LIHRKDGFGGHAVARGDAGDAITLADHVTLEALVTADLAGLHRANKQAGAFALGNAKLIGLALRRRAAAKKLRIELQQPLARYVRHLRDRAEVLRLGNGNHFEVEEAVVRIEALEAELIGV